MSFAIIFELAYETIHLLSREIFYSLFFFPPISWYSCCHWPLSTSPMLPLRSGREGLGTHSPRCSQLSSHICHASTEHAPRADTAVSASAGHGLTVKYESVSPPGVCCQLFALLQTSALVSSSKCSEKRLLSSFASAHSSHSPPWSLKLEPFGDWTGGKSEHETDVTGCSSPLLPSRTCWVWPCPSSLFPELSISLSFVLIFLPACHGRIMSKSQLGTARNPPAKKSLRFL